LSGAPSRQEMSRAVENVFTAVDAAIKTTTIP
jgi:hypothetical protein